MSHHMNDRAPLEQAQQLATARRYWNEAAASFDNEPDHGLRDPKLLSAWTSLLRQWLPAQPSTVLDIGCGTGSLSLILAQLGHAVTGIDFAPAMLAQAETKALACALPIKFHLMDAAQPQLPDHHFDLVLCRHLLWALPEMTQVLHRWVKLLQPAGRLLLIEGHWRTGAGLRAQEVVAALPAALTLRAIRNLSDDPELWGGPVADERYILIADHHPDARLTTID